MPGDPTKSFCIQKIFSVIGRVALTSSKGFREDLSDLSDWLLLDQNKKANDPNKLPECYLKKLMLLEEGMEDPPKWVAYFPRFDQLNDLGHNRSFEASDLLVVTTILAPLGEKIWCEMEKEKGRENPGEIDTETLTQMIVFWNSRCALTLDSVTMPLIQSISSIARMLEIKIDRSKRRRVATPMGGALVPALRVRYDLFRHIPKTDRMKIRRTQTTPLLDLSKTVEQLPCTFKNRLECEPARLGRACELLMPLFVEATFECAFDLRDEHDVIREML